MIVGEWQQNIRGDYGGFTHGPPRMVGHCTDGAWGGIEFTGSAPRAHYHVVHDVRPRSGRPRGSYQLCRLDRSCGGLKQPLNGPVTNKRTAIQWSIAGPAAEMHTLSAEECVWLGSQLAPVLRFYPSITTDHPPSIGPGDHSGAIATASWSGRHSAAEWNALTGWTQHQRVTGNDHYDIYMHEWQFSLIIATAHQQPQLPPQGDDDMLTADERELLRRAAAAYDTRNQFIETKDPETGATITPTSLVNRIRATQTNVAQIEDIVRAQSKDIAALTKKIDALAAGGGGTAPSPAAVAKAVNDDAANRRKTWT